MSATNSHRADERKAMNIYDRPTPVVDSLSDGWTIQSDRQRIAEALQLARRLEQERDALKGALLKARDELGVPQPGYPQPVANAVEIINEVLRAIEERK